MVDKIVELENNNSYVILEESILSNTKYYFGLRLNEKEEPTNNYLFFEEYKEGNDVNELTLNNVFPQTKEKGILNDYFEFSVETKIDKAKEVNYEISISKNTDKCTVNDQDIKVYLEKEKHHGIIYKMGNRDFHDEVIKKLNNKYNVSCFEENIEKIGEYTIKDKKDIIYHCYYIGINDKMVDDEYVSFDKKDVIRLDFEHIDRQIIFRILLREFFDVVVEKNNQKVQVILCIQILCFQQVNLAFIYMEFVLLLELFVLLWY